MLCFLGFQKFLPSFMKLGGIKIVAITGGEY